MNPRWNGVAFALCLATMGVASAQEAVMRHTAATNQLKRLAAALTAECLDGVRTREDWTMERPAGREQLLYMLGLDPRPGRSPLRAEITGTIERPGYRIEKVVFQSLPGLYVTGNFYVPADVRQPGPAILYLCGHSPHPAGAKTQYQDRTAWYASHGYCVLSLDTLEFGEVPGVHHGTHDLGMWHWLSLGYTPAGVEVWNAIRALDWLETRREVATDKIGVTGISGGGAITWYLAAVDERVAVAAPSCSTFTWGSQATHWLARGQCDCIYYHNAMGWDFPMVAALIAPRPLLITSGQRDTIFPPDGYHEVYRRGRKVYDLLAGGSSDRIREVDADVGHSDPPLFLRASREWMNRWLKGDTTPVDETESPAPLESPEALACLTQRPADAVNARIHDEFVRAARLATPASDGAWKRRRAELVGQLRDRVFRWFPDRRQPFEARVSGGGGSAGWATRYAACRDVTFETEPGVPLRARLLSPTNRTAAVPLMIYVKEAGESFYASDVDELLPLLGRAHVLVLQTRFTERTLSFGEYSDLERTSAWVGRTIAAMRVWDVLRGVEWALTEGDLVSTRVVLYGKGEMAAVALYAALFDERVAEVVVRDPPSSHWQGPALLNVLRVTDLPEVAGALAPRPITCLRAIPPGFELTQSIYRMQDAAAAWRAGGSLDEVVLGHDPRGRRQARR